MILTLQRGGWIRRAGGMGKRWKTDHEQSQRVDEAADGKKVKICHYLIVTGRQTRDRDTDSDY